MLPSLPSFPSSSTTAHRGSSNSPAPSDPPYRCPRLFSRDTLHSLTASPPPPSACFTARDLAGRPLVPLPAPPVSSPPTTEIALTVNRATQLRRLRWPRLFSTQNTHIVCSDPSTRLVPPTSSPPLPRPLACCLFRSSPLYAHAVPPPAPSSQRPLFWSLALLPAALSFYERFTGGVSTFPHPASTLYDPPSSCL